MNNIKDEVIGVGSMKGWTRGDMLSEYNSIVKCAEEGGASIEEWESMHENLAKIYICSSCDRFAHLVRLFLFGRFIRLRNEDL